MQQLRFATDFILDGIPRSRRAPEISTSSKKSSKL